MSSRDEALRAALARSRAGSTSPHLSGETYLGLREMIAEASGIAFDDRSRFIVERRLLPRLRALRLEDFESYYRYLLYNTDAGEEMARLLEAVTIRETYFFREHQQMQAVRDELLPLLAQENRESRRLCVWSAGCATGEEPYTIAMLILESGLFEGWRIDIYGTDLIPQAIGAARRGVYRDASMRAISDELRDRYFTREGDNAWRLAESVRRMVTFGTLNLIDTSRYSIFSDLDAIFCRNVMIYFAAETRRRIAEAFYGRLRDGGYLLLGHAESLLTLNTPFQLFHLRRDMIYRRG